MPNRDRTTICREIKERCRKTVENRNGRACPNLEGRRMSATDAPTGTDAASRSTYTPRTSPRPTTVTR